MTGSAWGDWANYTASPLRAFESELGVQAPVGFWDPVGFTSDGDVSTFKRRRSVELKHGRISMMAAMGVLTDVSCVTHCQLVKARQEVDAEWQRTLKSHGPCKTQSGAAKVEMEHIKPHTHTQQMQHMNRIRESEQRVRECESKIEQHFFFFSHT